MIRSVLICGFACILLACTPRVVADALDAPPDTLVDEGLAFLAEASRPPSDNRPTAESDLEPAIRSFLTRYADVPTAARLILSSQWKNASEGQRERFIDAFNDHVTNLLVEWVPTIRFDAVTVAPFTGDLDESPQLVKSVLQTQEGKLIDFVLVMHGRDGKWTIFDVITEGISYIKLFRNQFNAEISKFGLESAIRRFEERNAPDSASTEKPEG